MASIKNKVLRKVNYRIGELLLFVSHRKKIGPEKYSETELELSEEQLNKIFDTLGEIMNIPKK